MLAKLDLFCWIFVCSLKWPLNTLWLKKWFLSLWQPRSTQRLNSKILNFSNNHFGHLTSSKSRILWSCCCILIEIDFKPYFLCYEYGMKVAQCSNLIKSFLELITNFEILNFICKIEILKLKTSRKCRICSLDLSDLPFWPNF